MYIFDRKYKSNEEYLKSIYAHELTHAFSNKLKLPQWLNEGIALYTSEDVLNDRIVSKNSLELLNKESTKINISRLIIDSEIKMAYTYIKGYWTIKYLNEIYPGFIKRVFKKYNGNDIVNEILKKLDLETKWRRFDKDLDILLYCYFRNGDM